MTIVIIIVLLIHRIILYPPILSLSYSLLFCCYTHQPPLSLFLSVRDICLCQHHRLLYGSLILYCLVYLLYFTVCITRGHFSERADGREKILTANDAHFWPLFSPLISKGLSSDHAQLGVKLVRADSTIFSRALSFFIFRGKTHEWSLQSILLVRFLTRFFFYLKFS